MIAFRSHKRYYRYMAPHEPTRLHMNPCISSSGPHSQLPPETTWELLDGDTIGFGGPETIIARRSHVTNPFVFKYHQQAEAQQGDQVAQAVLMNEAGPAAARRSNNDTLQVGQAPDLECTPDHDALSDH